VLIAVIAMNVAACIAGLWVNLALRQHLRKHHPLLWNGFQFPRSSPFVASDDEKAEIFAQFGLSAYLRSGAWRALRDARLDRLIQVRRLSFYAVGFTMSATLVVMFMPAH
jgi:hypothetical protein